MTTLPNRSTIAGIGSTYGTVRSALGDLRDFLNEALGTSGTSPVIDGALLTNVTQIGVNVETPGTSAQIVGSLSVTSDGGTLNPGDGGIYLTGSSIFSSSLGSKINFLAPTGDALSIGRQTDSLYIRTKPTGNFNIYAGGVHSNSANTPGTGGAELLRVSANDFTYKGQTVYHSGNGVFIRKDAEDTAGEKITFTKGLASVANVEIGTVNASASINFVTTAVGNKLRLYPDGATENYTIGIQASSVFVRTLENFTIYRGGVFSPNAQTPGAGGTQLFNVNNTDITYKGNAVYHAGNSDFLTKTSVNRPGVIRVYNESADDNKFMVPQFNARGDGRMWLVSNAGEVRVSYADQAANADGATYRAGSTRPLMYEISAQRPGTHRLYVGNLEQTIWGEMHWNGTRMQYLATNSGGGGYETQVDYAANSARAQALHGHGIDDGTVRYHEISMGQGSVGGAALGGTWGVHQYAFASPFINLGGSYSVLISGNGRNWRGSTTTGIIGGSQVVWDYITGSGDPYIWVLSDHKGDIIGTWDAEDPAYREDPDVSPLSAEQKAYRVQIPQVEDVLPLLENFIDKNNVPNWMDKNNIKGDTFKEVFENILKKYSTSRNMMKEYNQGMDLKEFVYDLPGDDQKKNWRVQAILRAITALMGNNSSMNMHLLLSEFYRVDKKGKLSFK